MGAHVCEEIHCSLCVCAGSMYHLWIYLLYLLEATLHLSLFLSPKQFDEPTRQFLKGRSHSTDREKGERKHHHQYNLNLITANALTLTRTLQCRISHQTKQNKTKQSEHTHTYKVQIAFGTFELVNKCASPHVRSACCF